MLEIPALQKLDNLRAIIPTEILIWLANTPEDQLPAVINVALVDQLCAYMDPGKRHALGLPGPEQISVGGGFAAIIPAMLLIAASAGPVRKMTPHPGDGFTGNLDALLNTWTQSFRGFNHEGLPDWSNVEISGMERTEMYNYIGQKAHFIIRTRETAGWANVVLQLDPRQLSQMLKGVLDEFRYAERSSYQPYAPVDYSKSPVVRGAALQKYGHGNGMLFVSQEALKELSIELSAHPHCYAYGPVGEEFTKVSQLCLPDTYPQHKDSPLQTAIGRFGVGENELVLPDRRLVDPFGKPLSPDQLQQELSLEQLKQLLQDPRQVYVTVCQGERGKKAALLLNGISGANGGIGA